MDERLAGEQPHRTAARRLRGLLFGIVVASGALAAAYFAEASGGSGGPDGARPSWTHRYPADYGGPVWVAVEADDGVERAVRIVWGPWARDVDHPGTGEVAYQFTKAVTLGQRQSPTLTVTVDPPALVRFDTGEPPPGAVDVDEGWVAVP